MSGAIAAHPLALELPLKSQEEYEALRDSVRELGLLESIVLLDAMILDGVHRYRACIETGTEPRFVEFSGDDPVRYVAAKVALHRHLDESQRAWAAAGLVNTPAWRPPKGANLHPYTTEEASRDFSVSVRSIKSARKVREEAVPKLREAVRAGEIKVSAAAEIAGCDEFDQEEVLLADTAAERKTKVARAKARARAAPKKAAELVVQVPKDKALRHYTLEDWKQLSKSEKADVIEAGFQSRAGMNEQTTDSIEWARWSLNTVTGCLHDCPYCYARDIANNKRNSSVFPMGFEPAFHPSRLSAPSRQKVPDAAASDMSYRNLFANSMSDLFGRWVPGEWITATIRMAEINPQWNFLALTKFPQRAAEFEFPDNWWMGTTVDAQARVANAEKAFAKIQCETKWLSVEPLLEPLEFSSLDLFDWIVIGGASRSERTPAWEPPIRWIAQLDHAAREAGLRVYYKTNCGLSNAVRSVEFPWAKVKEPTLPASFRYLKGMAKEAAA